MARKGYLLLFIITLAMSFGISACEHSGNLKRLRVNKEMEMRQNWQDYDVYKMPRRDLSFQRGAAAFIYKLKDDKKILMDNRWVHVTDEELKAKNPIYFTTISAEIRGHNEELYGYLIYAQGDLVQVKIMDEQTVKLSYHYIQGYSN